MRISLIAAMADNRVIGINNSLPWKLPSDMRWFRQHTLGKPIIMGRKTFESFGGKPLPARTNIVITRNALWQGAADVVASSIDEALQAAAAASNADEVMIIGGASFYAQMLPRAERMYLTYVHCTPAGDAWFPDFVIEDWSEIERIEVTQDDKNPLDHSFVILQKNY